MQILQGVTQWLLVWSAVGAVCSVLLHLLTPWWKTQMGQHMMAYLLVIAVIVVETAVDQFLRPDPRWFEILQLVSFFAFPIVIWWRLILQWIWRPKKKEKQDA